ncbi:Receptor-like protein kinase [Actinidia chinensis var. chinensis]|uniref:non-specific serine/threonine protein kinase n=1 Tax=Actinidia chinensis var. chinensis TaxID=1590841 RepID=A0A2R6RKH2_ACTCC|nr:Receptor-like protein kinase [Actinidia chinensis var. chinensis]
MRYSPTPVLISLFFFCCLHHFFVTIAVDFPTLYSPIDNVAINCGSSGDSTAPDGREWVGDIGSKLAQLQQWNSKSVTLKDFHKLSDMVHTVPYMSARISRSQFSYTFKVNPGQKYIRLHFYPESYPGFERSKAFFTVKAGPYTLLSNFSASLTADALGLKSFVKEFCLNIGENQALTITFFPYPSSPSGSAYAFINGIEVISMPTSLYYTQSNDPGSLVVGRTYRFHIENSTALEVVQRLNVGGSSILPSQDSGMFREWSEDSNYLIESGVLPISTNIPIKYTSIPAYIAPQKVYQTTWSMGLTQQSNQMNNFTWKLSVDLGFRYLIRLHFCELEYWVKEIGQRKFCILINKQIAEASADIIEWSGGNGVAVYKDYVVMMEGDRMEGKRDLFIALRPHCHDRGTKYSSDPILNGLEVFKLSNPDNNLASPNPKPKPLAYARASKAPKPVILASRNGIVNGVIIVITLVNIVVHQLCFQAETSGKENISKSSRKETCQRFSLSEILSATNNFDDTLTIGCGGFGNVYKGFINEGTTTVAIKRLNSKSSQGAHEFWTEINMLSEVRHTHLVTLIGYCDECQEMILVYEYMAHGTLADHIYKFKRNGNGSSSLTWEQRLSICIGAARGLNYLHTGTHQSVIHRDVKSTNILLNENWVAKISDFGLSKMSVTSPYYSYVITNIKGTFGYLDPEYFSTHRLTRKSDVYAFGVVLFEVLCGRPAVDMGLEEEQHSLALWAQHCIREGTIHHIIDPNLRTQISPSCLKVFVEVSKKCLCNYSKDRPSMDDVVGSLELALAAQASSGSYKEGGAFGVGGADNKQIDGIMQLGGADLQGVESPVFEQDHTPLSNKRAELTITKADQSMALAAKDKDVQRKKVKDYGPDGGLSWWWRWNPFRQSSKKEKRLPPQLEDLCRYLSLAEIRMATNNFDCNNIIGGSGHTGNLYKGYIDNGRLVVAIKRFEIRSRWARQCWANIEILAELRHINLLSPIGYCSDEGEMILVYGYLGNGSLRNHLHGMHNHSHPLTWKRRLEICIGLARGLQYLHEGTRHTIIHRDITLSNILFDLDWVPKVSNLMFSKVLQPSSMATNGEFTSAVFGTYGYMAPEYMKTCYVTEKLDVYSLGVVLLEVLSGSPATNPIPHPGIYWPPVSYFKSCMNRKCIDCVIDPSLIGKITPECLREYVKIIWSCLLDQAIKRPSMSEVVGMLQRVLQLLENSADHVQFSFTSEDDPTETSFRAAAIQAYDTALFNDTGFMVTDTSGTSSSTALYPIETSTANLDDSDYYSSNLAR